MTARATIDRLMDFYPRPPRGGRQRIYNELLEIEQFLSTPSARRATGSGPGPVPDRGISIHALREEGDQTMQAPKDSTPISIHALREEGDEGDFFVYRMVL